MTDFFQKNLFKNISLDEYKHLISCMEGRIKTFRPDETICCYDSGSQEIGIIGQGRASVVRFEYNGARTILEQLVPQSIFGSMLSYESSDQTGVSVICDTECDVLFIKYDRICASCLRLSPPAYKKPYRSDLLPGQRSKPQGRGSFPAYHP